jgi:hypothetical protein
VTTQPAPGQQPRLAADAPVAPPAAPAPMAAAPVAQAAQAAPPVEETHPAGQA